MTPKNSCRKIDPDPVSVALGILGALGSLASLADYVHKVVDQHSEKKLRKRQVTQQLIELSVEIESSVNDIQAQYEKIRLLVAYNAPFLADTEGAPQEAMSVPFVFGGLKLVLPMKDFGAFSAAHQKIAQSSRDLLKNVYRTVRTLHVSGIGISPDIYQRLIELQTMMNRLLREQLDYGSALLLYSELLAFASDVCRKLKQEFLPDHGGTPQQERRVA